MEDWALIRQLQRVEGLSQAAIARRLSLSRNTVAKAIRSTDPPSYHRRPPVEGAFSEVEAAVRDLLGRFPSMPTAVLAERVGWTGSRSWFYANVARLRPGYRLADPADRLIHHPGEQIQCDLWFPGRLIPDHAGVARDFPVLVMVASHSRYASAVVLPSRRTGDLLAGMWWCLAEGFSAVPRQLLWDNEAGIGRGGKLAEGVAGFCGALGVRLVQARPYDPETKGVVERFNGYLATSFLPGRTFAAPGDFQDQLTGWLVIANQRTHRTTRTRPVQAMAAERNTMGPLPPVDPVYGHRFTTRLPRDYFVTAGGAAYSVHPGAIGRLVEVVVDLHTVTVTCAGRTVAAHQRAWGSGATVTDPAHVAAAAAMRRTHQAAATAGTTGTGRSGQVEVADLGVYDRLFGIEVA